MLVNKTGNNTNNTILGRDIHGGAFFKTSSSSQCDVLIVKKDKRFLLINANCFVHICEKETSEAVAIWLNDRNYYSINAYITLKEA